MKFTEIIQLYFNFCLGPIPAGYQVEIGAYASHVCRRVRIRGKLRLRCSRRRRRYRVSVYYHYYV